VCANSSQRPQRCEWPGLRESISEQRRNAHSGPTGVLLMSSDSSAAAALRSRSSGGYDLLMTSQGPGPGHEPGARRFASTQWSIVLAAGGNDTTRSAEALAALCRRYWYPLYAFVRRQGHGASEAEDLTQAFFARLIEKQVIAGADPHRGKFRSYLLSSLNHFLANEWDKGRAQKRGGSAHMLPLQIDDAERRYGLEVSHDLTPERLFERRWALTLLEGSLADLRAAYAREGKEALFERLKEFLAGATSEASYDGVADELVTIRGREPFRAFCHKSPQKIHVPLSRSSPYPDRPLIPIQKIHVPLSRSFRPRPAPL